MDEKYKQLGMEYPLGDTPEMDKEKAREFEDILAKMLRR